MVTVDKAGFLAGVIEGFYGQPWTQAERLTLFQWMSEWGLNTYLYAPKDDLKHRALWRETYSPSEATPLAENIRACAARGLRFFYALGPGLDIRYSSESDLDSLRARFGQMLRLGCQDFCLLFDDIPDRIDPADLTRWGSLASAQSQLTNTIFLWLRQQSPDSRFLFCPTPYCGRMAQRQLGGEGYLTTIGKELLPDIDVLWTGPEIISREITPAHVRELQGLLRRKPLIWDNLHANDYDGRRFYCGPYSGRAPELRDLVAGLLCNPNNEFALNYVPFRTLASFVQCQGTWDPRAEYLEAMRGWLPHFEALGQPVTLEDLVLLGDCYYLPHEAGPEAETLFQRIQDLVSTPPSQWGERTVAFQAQAARLRNLCARMAELRNRPLFYALSRRIWELREELDLLEGYVRLGLTDPQGKTPRTSDFHLPGTYRGGMVPKLQTLLMQEPDGSFHPAGQSAAPATLSQATPTL